MDDYKELFYIHKPHLHSVDIGDVSSRKQLRKDLQCQSFKWYLDNILPELFVTSHSLGYGRCYNNIDGKTHCLDKLNNDETKPYNLKM